MARRVVAANADGLVVRAFPGTMCAGVRLMADWALARRGVAISLVKFVVVELAV